MFKDPSLSSGVKFSDLEDALCIFKPVSVEEDVKTRHGVTEAVKSLIWNVDEEQALGENLIFPKYVQGALRSEIGELVLARVVRGKAKSGGQSDPWLLAEVDDKDRKKAMAYWETVSKGATKVQDNGDEAEDFEY